MIDRFYSSVKSFHLSVRITFKILCAIFQLFVHTNMTSAIGHYKEFCPEIDRRPLPIILFDKSLQYGKYPKPWNHTYGGYIKKLTNFEPVQI